MHAPAAGTGAVEVIQQLLTEVRVSTVVDDGMGSLAGRQAAQVGQALLGDDDLHIVFGVIHMGDHRHNGGDGSVLGGGRGYEDRQVAVAGEVAGAADTVHHPCTHDMG